MRRVLSFAWQSRYVTAALVVLVAAGSVAITAVAGPSRTKGAGNISVLKATSAVDTCGYPIANSPAFPRGATTFNESTTIKRISATNAGIPGDKIIVYYSDEDALTLGGAGADASPATKKTGSDDLSPNFGAQTLDPSGRLLQPELYITDITSNGSSKSGDWQAGPLHNSTGFSPNEIHGSYKPSNGADPVKNSASPQLGGLGDWPSGLKNEGYTAAIVWNTSSLGLIRGHVYRLQFVYSDATNKTGGDSGEHCTTVGRVDVITIAPRTQTYNSSKSNSANQLTDEGTLSGGFNPTGTITFTLYGPDDTNCSGAPVGSDTATVNGNGTYSGTVTIAAPGATTAPGVYRWIANYSGDTNNTRTTNVCNDTHNGSEEHTAVIIEALNSAQDFQPRDTATITVTGTSTPPLNGTLTFDLYKGACVPGNLLDELTSPVSGNGDYTVTDPNFLSALVAANPNVPQGTSGTYNWKISYSGDTNGNADIDGACGRENSIVDDGARSETGIN
jgi:hypothetical protein